ncbi:MAG: hypothetical protein KO463_06955 [Candidatus Methanofastidiosa archaeon]|jgi:hypothetical protein|nr:hypothetical protein [Candidatus Methanofastidiosa archaeon]
MKTDLDVTRISILVSLIAALSLVATVSGITSDDGPGRYVYTSIRGEDITIYGEGVYKHMSEEVAVQGIAQDYVTLFVGIPLLFAGLILARRGSVRGLVLMAGVLGYFLVTYLFYLTMGMYNSLYLVYAALLCLTFFGLALAVKALVALDRTVWDKAARLIRYEGIFLVANSIMVTFLWLGIVVPPLIDGSLYPVQVEHYTTLIVQGFDLGLLLPIGIVVGVLAAKKRYHGLLFTPPYVVFLSVLMAALTAKILFMADAGYNVIPVIFIMPTICLIASSCSIAVLHRL